VNEQCDGVGRRVAALLVACVVVGMMPAVCAVKNADVFGSAQAAQRGEEPWKQEFDDVCRKTTDSMALSEEDLKSLIERCEKLKPAIERLDETPRKVYGYKLDMCRKLFVFMLGSKKK
jgi:hypothetical protein